MEEAEDMEISARIKVPMRFNFRKRFEGAPEYFASTDTPGAGVQQYMTVSISISTSRCT